MIVDPFWGALLKLGSEIEGRCVPAARAVMFVSPGSGGGYLAADWLRSSTLRALSARRSTSAEAALTSADSSVPLRCGSTWVLAATGGAFFTKSPIASRSSALSDTEH